MATTTFPTERLPPHRLRLSVLLAAMMLAAALLVWRLVYWQVLQHDHLAERARIQHTLDVQVPARRGAIFDSQGHLLAGNLSVSFVYAQPRQVREPEAAAAKLAPLLGTPPERLLSLLQERQRQYVRLTPRKVSPEVSDQIAALRLHGIFLEPTTRRVYPDGMAAAHVLGFADGENQGWNGVEGHHNNTVGGRPGRLRAERDTAGNEIGIGYRSFSPPQDGQDVVLTIDRTIQYLAERELERAIARHRATGGTIIVLRVKTGAILAMASRPAYDPNLYHEYASEQSLFLNPAIAQQYEPGSTFKVVTMAAALNERIVSAGTTVNDTGAVSIGGHTIRNWDGRANGVISMVGVLGRSSNVGASWVAQLLGRERFYKYVQAFGFGQPTGVDLQGEARGTVKDPASRDWGPADLATNSFGQAISVTPLQVAAAVGAIANNGVLMRPYVVEQVRDPVDGRVVRSARPQAVRQVVSPQTAKTVLGMLVSSLEEGETTGVLIPGYKVGGKTGTASIPIAGGYDPKWTIASFVGVALAHDPQVVILVKIDRPQDEPWGALIAKPVFGILASDLLLYLRIPPTEPPVVGRR